MAKAFLAAALGLALVTPAFAIGGGHAVAGAATGAAVGHHEESRSKDSK